MPSSSPQMHELIKLLFNSEVDEQGPMDFLKSKGYILEDNWCWTMPSVDHFVDVKEELCIRFLIEEWDFGGIQE